jgi:hypothetical protein
MASRSSAMVELGLGDWTGSCCVKASAAAPANTFAVQSAHADVRHGHRRFRRKELRVQRKVLPTAEPAAAPMIAGKRSTAATTAANNTRRKISAARAPLKAIAAKTTTETISHTRGAVRRLSRNSSRRLRPLDCDAVCRMFIGEDERSWLRQRVGFHSF